MKLNQHNLKYYPWAIEALTRDNYVCVDCGSGKNVVVHHVDESRKRGILNNKPDNLISVCKKCHAIRHGLTKTGKTTLVTDPDVIEMRESGMTFTQIGKILKFSRQRACQIYRRNLTP